MTCLAVHIIRPVLLWALHFIAVYALISASCAPRALLEIEITRATVAAITLLAGIAALAWAIGAANTVRRGSTETDARTLARGVLWTNAFSFLAILANLWPVAWMTGCSG